MIQTLCQSLKRNLAPYNFETLSEVPVVTLLMALLRAMGVPCRFHGFTINKALQRGAITGVAYRLAPTASSTAGLMSGGMASTMTSNAGCFATWCATG
jgi:hypothetical protein